MLRHSLKHGVALMALAAMAPLSADDGGDTSGGSGDRPLDEDEAAFRDEVAKAAARIQAAREELANAYDAGRSLVDRANKMAADTADLLGPLVQQVQTPPPEAPAEIAELAPPAS